MMVPVGRLILLRSVPPARMVAAMVWFTVPGAIGRLAGPLFGGLIVTIASWRWIFLLNVPFGVLGVLLARDFSPAFVVVGILTLCSLFFFVQLAHDEGAELRRR